MKSIVIIEAISMFLGLFTPLVLFLVFRAGIINARFNPALSQRSLKIAGVLILGWASIIWITTLVGSFAYTENDAFPKFLVALVFPVAVMIYMFKSPVFREIIDRIPISKLVGSQFWRIFGAVFFLVALSGLGPMSLIGSGYGDVLTGTLSITALLAIVYRSKKSRLLIWLFNLVGMTDLVLILIILLGNYPIWSEAAPSSAGVGSYPLMLIAGLAAPVALLLHILTVRKLMLDRSAIG